MNCELEKWHLSIVPMFCVWDRSSAASISSRMYMGAGLKRSMANTRERAMSDLCPPLSSDSESFQTAPNPTRISSPSITDCPSGGSSFAVAPGSRVEKIEAKSLLTFCHVTCSASFFFSSSSAMTLSILRLSFSMILRFEVRSWYSCSAFSKRVITFLLIFFESTCCSLLSALLSLWVARMSRDSKSKSPPDTPKSVFDSRIHRWFFSRVATSSSDWSRSFAMERCVCSSCLRSRTTISARSTSSSLCLLRSPMLWSLSASRFRSSSSPCLLVS
mmetsp:Transcript_761/g.2466  ORF Transcript_761/g.2466 Transcript_761/m.2466 type:complete len:274 (+) Transcript_761:1683-2504(+)